MLMLVVDPLSEEVESYITGTGRTRGFTHVLLADAPVTDTEFLKRAKILSSMCREEGLDFLVESRLGTARFTGADGLHIPTAKPTLPFPLLRSFVDEPWSQQGSYDEQDDEAQQENKKRILGCVVNNLQEAATAAVNNCDYVVVDVGIADEKLEEGEEEEEEDDDENLFDDEVLSTSGATGGVEDGAPLNMSRRLKKRILAMRRVLHTPGGRRVRLIASHELCMQLGGGVYGRGLSNAFDIGADGAQFVASRALAQMKQALIERQRAAAEAEATPKAILAPSGRVFGAAALIAGGTVGAGIIALPVKTAAAGFVPSAVALVAVWAFMNCTALLLLEMSLWFGPKSNVTTMALKTLGRPMKFICAALYLFIYMATLTAYIAEGASLSRGVVAAVAGYGSTALGGELAATLSGVVAVAQSKAVWIGASCCATFTAFFGAFVYAGPEPTDVVNSICLFFAMACYVTLVAIAAGSIRSDLLMRMNWGSAVSCLPIMVVSLTFHNIVPSMLSYLGTARRVVYAILIGSGIPLAMYLVWQMAILGTVDLSAAAVPGVPASGNQVMQALKETAGAFANECVRAFSLFAIITSFLGVLLGFIDFLLDLFPPKDHDKQSGEEEENDADTDASTNSEEDDDALADAPLTKAEKEAAANKQKWTRRLVATMAALTGPLIVASTCPTIFLPALEFSGSFRLILFGILPALMVWSGRYNGILGRGRKSCNVRGKDFRENSPDLTNKPWLPGGKPLLLLIGSIAVMVLGIEWHGKIARMMMG